MIAFVNASPLIFLAKIDQLELLNQLFSKVITSSEVRNEVLDDESHDEAINLKNAFERFILVKKSMDESLTNKIAEMGRVQRGEASIISLAREYGEENEKIIVVDDKTARETARILGFSITGTIGILLRGVREGLLTTSEGKLLIKELITKHDYRISVYAYIEIEEKLNNLNS